ncbi:MAG: hypothetical protein IJY18_03130 [Clostridia bacterium]|nr:hypothetical protein [Clostridia bacterium]
MIRSMKEECLDKRDAILVKLSGRDISKIQDYECDSFYALYSELARLSDNLIPYLSGAELQEYLKLKGLCESRAEKLMRQKKTKR